MPARQLLMVVRSLTKASKLLAEQHIHDGRVTVNGRIRTQPFFKLEVGDRVDVEFEQPVTISNVDKKAGGRAFEMLFEDDNIIVVNKPPNLLTVPTPHKEKTTLISQIDRHLKRRASEQKSFCVHRLDRGVSGILVFAKTLETAEKLRDQFSERKPKRQYIAILAGELEQAEGTFRTYLKSDADLNQFSTSDSTEGQLAITHFRVFAKWPSATMVEIWLETGRRNQIRVHFAEAGHPVLGDPRYQRNMATHPFWPFERIALHAESLGIVHPETRKPMEWRTSWPDEFRTFRRKIEQA
jgi:23S rRNA pseudouridine1911/1915/1917 synthase